MLQLNSLAKPYLSTSAIFISLVKPHLSACVLGCGFARLIHMSSAGHIPDVLVFVCW